MEDRQLTILMVDDNLDHIELTWRAFRFFYSADQFFACCTLYEALHWLQDHQPDVIIADLHLPDGSGLEFLDHPTLNGKVPIAIITNQGDELRAVQAIKHGAMDYLVKGTDTFRRIPSVAHRIYRQWQVIEAKKDAEEKLRQHERLLNSILQSTRDGYILVDPNGKFLDVNRAYVNLLGYSPEELIGKSIADVEAILTAEQITATFDKIRREGSVLFETCHRHRDGHLIDVEVSLTWLPEHGGKMVTFVRDTRVRNAMQKALRQSKVHVERRLEEMIVLRNIALVVISHRESQAVIDALLHQLLQLKDILGICLLTWDNERVGWSVKASLPKGVQCRFDDLPQWLKRELELVSLQPQPRFVQPDPHAVIALPDPFSTCAVLAILPLVEHDQILGALLLVASAAQTFDEEWRDFCQALAMQTAIALENVYLYEMLTKEHQALLEAYQAILEAWSRTLEVRDKETQGHSQRVVEIGLKLARAFGLPEAELEAFRRGAMLHDIGKICIPDTILLKPDKLEEKEWEIMRQHPLYAREMMQGIRILEDAMDIPLYHHEHWDGKGYPFGLRGEEIPLSARIFAVADVWDALTSNRPYRPAWNRELAIEYIKMQAGLQFDPKVVDIFIRLFEAGEIE